MPDPYTPPLTDFAFNDDEAGAINAALQTASPWDWTPADNAVSAALDSAKVKIRDYHMARHGGLCCYCKTNLNGGGPFMTDREHVLPKSKTAYRPFAYAIWNLGASCKRCNLQLKKARDDFVIDKLDPARFEDSENYRLIHPNFNYYFDHIERYSAQANGRVFVLFRCRDTEKGIYTHSYFNLRALEVDTLDEAQAGRASTSETELVGDIRKLAAQFGQ